MPTHASVIWSTGPNSAADDLKELPREVRAALMDVAERALVTVPTPTLSADEGSLGGGMLYRRAATRAQMAALEAEDDGAASTPATVDYYFVYRGLTAVEKIHYPGGMFFVHRIVNNLNLAWIYEQTLLRAKR